MQARYYDPVIGRFYSNDPIGAVAHLSTQNGIQGFNRYAYGNNNPYKYTDPDGKAVFTAIAVGVARCASNAACRGAAISLGQAIVGAFSENSNSDNDNSANDKSKSKRRAKRSHGTPTSKPGRNQQGRPGTPRHEVVEGADSQPVGVVDGSNDTVEDHGDHVEVGDIKTEEPTNKHDQPRIRKPKATEDF